LGAEKAILAIIFGILAFKEIKEKELTGKYSSHGRDNPRNNLHNTADNHISSYNENNTDYQVSKGVPKKKE